jgi:hypothetical protein
MLKVLATVEGKREREKETNVLSVSGRSSRVSLATWWSEMSTLRQRHRDMDRDRDIYRYRDRDTVIVTVPAIRR